MTSKRQGLTALAVALLFCTAHAPCESVDCDSVKASFSEKLAKMLEAGDPVKMASLREKLTEEKGCRFKTLHPSRVHLGAQELYKRCRDSVVIVGKIYKCSKCDKWHTSTASGFAVSKDGAIVTNYHVVGSDEKSEAVAVMTRDGRMLPVRDILASSKKQDLLVLKVDADDLAPLPIAGRAEVGASIYCISHPVNHFYTITEGIVAGDFQREEDRHEIAVTCDYAKGSSGAPILDATGTVVAIVRVTHPVYYEKQDGQPTKLQMVWKFSVPASALLDLLSGG